MDKKVTDLAVMAKSIANVQTLDRNTNQLQQNLQQALNPIIKNPQNNARLIPNVALSVGSNTINTGLNASLNGYSIVMKSGPANIHDNQANNPNPSKTLILVSDTAVTVSISVF